MNPPTVEFVKDALRVARAATDGPWSVEVDGIMRRIPNTSGRVLIVKIPNDHCSENAAHIAKFDPPTVIALMEDWLRLREQNQIYVEGLDLIAGTNGAEHNNPRWKAAETLKRAALAKQG